MPWTEHEASARPTVAGLPMPPDGAAHQRAASAVALGRGATFGGSGAAPAARHESATLLHPPRAGYSTRMAESPVHLLRLHSRHAPFNARGLAAHATALVDAAGVRPTNASARAAPSARAVRFYVANGLLDRPDGAGTSATYNYRHLLQLLAIKIRQREGQTLESIKREMKEVSGDALERRVATSLAPALMTDNGASARVPDDRPATWRRLPVADGIELHVRDDSPAAREDALLAMREAVRAAITRG
jgi:DNA-binding transcriptional MerR regulator